MQDILKFRKNGYTVILERIQNVIEIRIEDTLGDFIKNLYPGDQLYERLSSCMRYDRLNRNKKLKLTVLEELYDDSDSDESSDADSESEDDSVVEEPVIPNIDAVDKKMFVNTWTSKFVDRIYKVYFKVQFKLGSTKYRYDLQRVSMTSTQVTDEFHRLNGQLLAEIEYLKHTVEHLREKTDWCFDIESANIARQTEDIRNIRRMVEIVDRNTKVTWLIARITFWWCFILTLVLITNWIAPGFLAGVCLAIIDYFRGWFGNNMDGLVLAYNRVKYKVVQYFNTSVVANSI